MNAAARRSSPVVSACVAVVASAQTWIELGPAPITGLSYTGRISAVACSRTDPNLYFVAAADGGVWRTIDGGASWTPITDHLPTTAIGALALHPHDENVVYAGSGEANFANHSRYGLGLYRSTDGGDTWTTLAEDVFAGRCFSAIVINPRRPSTLWAAVTRAGGFPELAAAKGHPQALGPVGVFRSDDGGETWKQLAGGLPALSATSLTLDPTDPEVVYAGIGHIFGDVSNGVYKSLDGGASWSRLSVGLPDATVGRVTVAVAPGDPSRLYALITRPADAAGGSASMLGAYRSLDGGASWVLLPLPNIQATYGWYLSVVCVHPDDEDIVFMGGVPLRRSLNGGQSWATVTPPHVDLHAAAWDAAGRLVVGDDGGVHRSANLGSSWTALNAGLGAVQFYAGLSPHPSDDLILFGGTQDNGTNRRTTAGVGWTQVLGGDGGWTQIHPFDPSRVFAEFQGTGNLYRSINGGTSFSFSGSGIVGSDRNCFLPPYLVDPHQPDRMLYATHRVYRSTNGGVSWSPISADLTSGPPAAIRALAIAPSVPSVVYAATNDGRVLRSADGGVEFDVVLSGVPGWTRVTRELCVSSRDPDVVWLAVSRFGVSRVRGSRDGGGAWDSLDGDLPDVPVNVIAVDERVEPAVLYAGADDGVFRSVDGGLSWTRFGTGLPRAAVIDLRAEPDRQRLLAATQGRGAWSIAMLVPGDVDGDCQVGQSDLALVLSAYGSGAGDPRFVPGADFDGDGVVDQGDLGVLLQRYGKSCSDT